MKPKIIIDKKILAIAADEAVGMVLDRTSQGKDTQGKPFKPYSTKPFGMPLGAYYQNTTGRQRANLKDRTQIFTSKRSGKKWIIIEGGYFAYKYARFPQRNGIVDLQVRGMRGGMLSNLQVLTTKNDQITIGFTTTEAKTLAGYNIEKGRKFLGLNPKEIEKLTEIIGKGIKIEIPEINQNK